MRHNNIQHASDCLICNGPLKPWSKKRCSGQVYAYDQCSKCGFVFVNPRPSLKELGQFYQNYVTDRKPRSPSAWRDPKRQVTNMIKLSNKEKGDFLDIGCGNGSACLVASEAGLNVTALEVDETAIASALTVPHIELHECLFEDYQAGNRKYDFILASQVLEHSFDPAGFAEKCAELLNPGGVVCIALPNYRSVFRLLLGVNDPYFIPPAHLNHFSRKSLGNLFQNCGLRSLSFNDLSQLPVDKLARKHAPNSLQGPAKLVFRVAGSLLNVFGVATHSGVMLEAYFTWD